MSETITTPQEQTQSGLDRVSKDPAFIWGDHQPEITTETATAETEKLETPDPVDNTPDPEAEKSQDSAPTDTATKPDAETTDTVADEGFKDEVEQPQEDNSWRAYFEENQIPIPEDFSEENGHEYYAQVKVQEAIAAKEADFFSGLPENTRAEGQMIVELMKTGQTLEQIMAPIQQIKEWKSLPKEQLVRQKYEAMQGYGQAEVDLKMQQIEESKTLDIEYNIVMANVNQIEQGLLAKQQQEIKYFQYQQDQVKEQKRTQELNSVKAALDRVPTFMEKKLSEDNKRSVLQSIANGEFEKASPQEKAEFMLWKKYGKQGLKDLQARATEKALLEKKKEQHNIPIEVKGGNRTSVTTQFKTGMERAENDPQFA